MSKELLKKSIEIWKQAHKRLLKVQGKKIDRDYCFPKLVVKNKTIFKHGVEDCPLCLRYNYNCFGCPIKLYTNNSCYSTPYETLYNYISHEKPKTVTKKIILYHQRMINLMEKIYKKI